MILWRPSMPPMGYVTARYAHPRLDWIERRGDLRGLLAFETTHVLGAAFIVAVANTMPCCHAIVTLEQRRRQYKNRLQYSSSIIVSTGRFP